MHVVHIYSVSEKGFPHLKWMPFCLIKAALFYSAKQPFFVSSNCIYFLARALVIGTSGGMVRCLHCDSCSMHETCIVLWIITSVELRSRGAPQALSLLCLELAQESGLRVDLLSTLQLQSTTLLLRQTCAIIFLYIIHPNSAPFVILVIFCGALIRQNTVNYMHQVLLG